MNEYETIKSARAMLQASHRVAQSEKTIAGYNQKAVRINRLAKERGGRSFDSLIAAAKETKSANTWFSRRASLMHALRTTIEILLTEQDKAQRALKEARIPLEDPAWGQWRELVGKIASALAKYDRLQQEPGPAIEDRRPRQSKRKHMRGLPKDWRERIIARMPKYRAAVLTQAVTGCRPEEITKGVKLWIEDGTLIAEIQGSKVTEKSGQPWRRMFWPVDSESALVAQLVEAVRGGLTVARIEDAKAYSGAVRSAGEREWPKRTKNVTPYCFRHAAASDMKAAGMEDDVISQALGHCADVARTYYGQWQMGAKTGGVVPKSVEAARKIRIKKAVVVSRKKKASP